MRSAWRRPFAVVLACHAGVFLAFSAAFPFMSLYVQQLGITDRGAAAGWAGLINGTSTALVSVMNPLWGSAADRWGAKVGLVRSLSFCVLGLLVCGLATTPELVLVGRLIQGFGGGANAASIIVVTNIVPTTALGTTMGLMQTAQSLSGALGPAVGGVVGDVAGFRYAFIGAAILLALVTAAVTIFVREPKREFHSRNRERFFAGLKYTFQDPRVRKLLVVFFGFHVAYQSIWTFLPLRVQDIVVDQSLVGRWSGAAALGDALGIAAGASLIAWLSSRLPVTAGMLVAAVCLVAGASTVLQFLTPWPEALIALRVLVGLCYGGAVVLMRATLGEVADPTRRGATFGVAQSAFAGGFAFGALVGSVAIAASGLGAAFLASAGAFGLVAVWSVTAFPARTS